MYFVFRFAIALFFMVIYSLLTRQSPDSIRLFKRPYVTDCWINIKQFAFIIVQLFPGMK